MNRYNPEYSFNPKANERPAFADKLGSLLPGVAFEEPAEMLEARTAILEALAMDSQDQELLRSIWIEYANLCEQIVDNKADTSPQARAQLQIAVLVHKALIFREANNLERYCLDLSDAEEYAYNMRFDEIAVAIGAELDNLMS